MHFNSLEFFIFIPIVFFLYWLVCREYKWQNLLVVVASYIFYGWWDWRFLLLIALTSFCSYTSGLLLEHYEGQRRLSQIVSAANIVINIGILGTFKYYNFFIENLDAMLGMVGYHTDWVTMNIILPVGISFYTFQALSYTIDVYLKRLPATHDIVSFFAYISFFPQLVAGPIERRNEADAMGISEKTRRSRQLCHGSQRILGTLCRTARTDADHHWYTVHITDLLRFFWLLGHCHRMLTVVWFQLDAELQLPILFKKHT